MIKFREFYDKDQIDKIKTDPSFKVKEDFSNSVNAFLTWLQEQSQDSDIEEIKNKILSFGSELEDKNEEMKNLIADKSTLAQYERLYNGIMGQIEQFEDPPQNITPMLDSLKDSLNQLYVFSQSKISI